MYFPNESIINNPTHKNVQCQSFNALNPKGSCPKGDTCEYVHLSKRQFRRERSRHVCLQAAVGTEETYSDLEPQEQPPTEREGDAQPSEEQTPAVSPARATQPFLENIMIGGQLYSPVTAPNSGQQAVSPMPSLPQTPLSNHLTHNAGHNFGQSSVTLSRRDTLVPMPLDLLPTITYKDLKRSIKLLMTPIKQYPMLCEKLEYTPKTHAIKNYALNELLCEIHKLAMCFDEIEFTHVP